MIQTLLAANVRGRHVSQLKGYSFGSDFAGLFDSEDRVVDVVRVIWDGSPTYGTVLGFMREGRRYTKHAPLIVVDGELVTQGQNDNRRPYGFRL